MRFQRLDLNLLVALEVLLTEESVTIAAERLHLSQSGMSSALNRIREYFDDELLISRGGKMVLTPRAEELLTPVRNILLQIKANITTRPEFHPGEAERRFAIIASDYTIEVALAGALKRISKIAPDVSFDFLPLDDHPVDRLERGEADLWITLHHAASPDLPSEALFQDDYVVVACKHNTAIRGALDKTLYFDLGHVTTRFGKARQPAFEEYFLQSMQSRRRIEVIAPSFTMAPSFVLGTNRIATMHRRLAEIIARTLPVKLYPLPIDIPPIQQVVQWSRSSTNDLGLRWLIDQIRDHMDDLSQPAAVDLKSTRIRGPRPNAAT